MALDHDKVETASCPTKLAFCDCVIRHPIFAAISDVGFYFVLLKNPNA